MSLKPKSTGAAAQVKAAAADAQSPNVAEAADCLAGAERGSLSLKLKADQLLLLQMSSTPAGF